MADRREQESFNDVKHLNIKLQRDELAMNLGGGLPRNSLILIEGKDGSGKSIFVQRLAYALLLHEATVTYISTELNTISFIEQMESVDYDIKKYLLHDKLLFIPMFPLLGKTEFDQNFLDRLLLNPKLFENDIIIFDTLSFLLVQNNIPQSKTFAVINFLKKAVTLGKIIIFNVDPDHLNEQFLTLLRSVSDSFFTMQIKDFAGTMVRVISVNRFKRPMGPFQNKIPFRIEPGKGLVIEIASFD
ncbi:MAG: hypothetical protein H6502_02670 [Candidatus Woesearchaeota archaeon]|nr:MAG: hypothetical protein H6502_02670 [Candidatus Woesearchaeota archaeon]